jgi:hypothetical protein
VTCILIARQRLGEHIPAETNGRNNTTSIARQRISNHTSSTIERLCFLRGACRGVILKTIGATRQWNPCRGGVEYLHRDPASRRRRWKGKSQIWDTKIWSRVPRELDPRKTTLARASSICKRETRPLIREGAPEKQDRNCQTVINIWSWDGAGHQDLLTDWPSVAMWLWLWLQGSWGFSYGVLTSGQRKLKILHCWDSLPGNVQWRHCRGIAIVESCYQVKTSGSGPRRLSVEWFVGGNQQ